MHKYTDSLHTKSTELTFATVTLSNLNWYEHFYTLYYGRY